jgi:hypothetical protein
MKRNRKILLVTLLAGGVAAAAVVSAGPGFGPGSCAQGYGPGGGPMMQGQGYGPGNGPMMQGQGYGPGHGSMMQGQGYGHGPMMRGDGSGPYGGMHGRWEQGPEAFAQRLERMHDRIGITAAQEPAWQAFAAKVAAQGERMQAHHEAMRAQWAQDDDLTAPERIQRRAEMMGERLGAMSDMAEAVTTLYGELTPEQQKLFDLMQPMGGHHRRAF